MKINEEIFPINKFTFYKTLPLVVSLILTFYSYFPLPLDIANNAKPAISLMCAYFWLVYRPDIFNLGIVFIFGILTDAASAIPFGSGLVPLLIMYLLVINLIKYLNGRVFIVLWFGIALLLPFCLFSQWLLLFFYYEQFLPIMPLFFTYLTSLACYPLVGGINALVLNNFLQEDM